VTVNYQQLLLVSINTSSGNRNVSIWHPSVCPVGTLHSTWLTRGSTWCRSAHFRPNIILKERTYLLNQPMFQSSSSNDGADSMTSNIAPWVCSHLGWVPAMENCWGLEDCCSGVFTGMHSCCSTNGVKAQQRQRKYKLELWAQIPATA